MFEVWVPVPVMDWAPGALHGVRGDRIPVFHANFAAVRLICDEAAAPARRRLAANSKELARAKKRSLRLCFGPFESSRSGNARACAVTTPARVRMSRAAAAERATGHAWGRGFARQANHGRGRALPPPLLISNDSFFIYCARWFAAKSNAGRTCAMICSVSGWCCGRVEGWVCLCDFFYFFNYFVWCFVRLFVLFFFLF